MESVQRSLNSLIASVAGSAYSIARNPTIQDKKMERRKELSKEQKNEIKKNVSQEDEKDALSRQINRLNQKKETKEAYKKRLEAVKEYSELNQKIMSRGLL